MNESQTPAWPSMEAGAASPPNTYEEAQRLAGGGYRFNPTYRAYSPYVPPPQERPWKLRELGLFLGVLAAADLLLWNSFGGVSFAIFLIVAAAVAVVSARVRRAPLRLAFTGALFLGVVARSVVLPTASTVVLGLLLLFALVVQLRTRSGASTNVLLSFGRTLLSYPSRVYALARGTGRVFRGVPLKPGFALQVFVPLGLVSLFGGVFALANPLVGRYVGVAATWVTSHIAFPDALRVMFWIALIPLGILLIRPAVRFATVAPPVDRSESAKSLSVSIATNSLVGLNLAFAGFLALDANYLWRGAPPPGMTTQTYAHEGAFWLTVALFLTTVVLGVLFRGALAFDARAKLSRRLAWVWIAQNALLAASAFRRMAIHVEYSGLSNLRIFGYFGATLVVVGLVLVAMKLHGVRTARWVIARQLDAFAIAAAIFALLPTHRISAHVNVARIESGELRPALHLFAQAKEEESADVLLPLIHHPDARIREGVAQLLLEQVDDARNTYDVHKWSSSLLPRKVSGTLEAARPELVRMQGNKDGAAVRNTLYHLVTAANEGQSLELLLAIPPAVSRSSDYDDPVRNTY